MKPRTSCRRLFFSHGFSTPRPPPWHPQLSYGDGDDFNTAHIGADDFIKADVFSTKFRAHGTEFQAHAGTDDRQRNASS